MLFSLTLRSQKKKCQQPYVLHCVNFRSKLLKTDIVEFQFSTTYGSCKVTTNYWLEMGCCRSGVSEATEPVLLPAIKPVPLPDLHFNVAMCGPACSGKSTILQQLLFNDNDFRSKRDVAAIRRHVCVSIIWSIVQLCKIIMTQNDKKFATFQSKVKLISMTGDPLVDPHNVTHYYFTEDDNDEDKASIDAYINIMCDYYRFDFFQDTVSIKNLDKFQINWASLFTFVCYLRSDTIRDLKILYNCNQIKYAYNKYHHLYPFMQHLDYYMENIDRIVQIEFDGKGNNETSFKTFIPTQLDVLKRYSPSSTVVTYGIAFPASNFHHMYNFFFNDNDNNNNNNDNNDNIDNNSVGNIQIRRNVICKLHVIPEKNQPKYRLEEFSDYQAVLYVAGLDEYCKPPYVYTILIGLKLYFNF